jgi:hypothetical protein
MSKHFPESARIRYNEERAHKAKVNRAGFDAQPREAFDLPKSNFDRFDDGNSIDHRKFKKNLYLALACLPAPVMFNILSNSTTENLGSGVMLSVITLGAFWRYIQLSD